MSCGLAPNVIDLDWSLMLRPLQNRLQSPRSSRKSLGRRFGPPIDHRAGGVN